MQRPNKTDNQILENFNKTLDQWIAALANYTISQLHMKPDSNIWSLGQVYEHILDDTNWYNEQMKASITDTKNANEPMTERASTLLTQGAFKEARIQGDQTNAQNIKQPTSISQLKAELKKLKVDTFSIWRKGQNTTAIGKSEHPGFGYLTYYEWLAFSEIHLRHHFKQKARLDEFLNQH